MLTALSIKNFALIEDAEVRFGPGLNVITGETGAGKSILLGAMTMILGERASTDQIRSGCDKAVIEGTFRGTLPSGVLARLVQEGVESSPGAELTLRRELSTKGQSRCFLNDNLITVSLLKSIGDALVDLHGQHEHQSLLNQELHRDFVDAFAGTSLLVAATTTLFRSAERLRQQIADIEKNRSQLAEKKDWYAHQLKEITDIAPKPGEEEALLQEEKLLSGAERLYELSSRVFDRLYESESSVLGALNESEHHVTELSRIDDRFNDIAAQFQSAKITFDEIARWIGDYKNKVAFDPERLESIRERQLNLQRLRKKYGSVSAALEKQSELESLVNVSENYDEEIRKLKDQWNRSVGDYMASAAALSKKRKAKAAELDRSVVDEMKKLGMDHVRFLTQFSVVSETNAWGSLEGRPVTCFEHGFDVVEFYLSTNAGEPVKPLAKIASGGEISRIMLSLKTALADADRTPVLVFDEIDTGISGRVAQAVGKALVELSIKHQVICITHLPQIAGLSQSHFSVRKHSTKSKTTTEINRLNKDEKIHEVAKLLGGETVTEANLKNARELIDAG